MGLLDVLRGMSNGPHGQPTPGTQTKGMSPLTMGLLALLAYKAFKGGSPFGGLFGQASNPGGMPSDGRVARPGASAPGAGPQGGGLTDWLSSGLGGALTGGAAGGLVTGGLTELLRRFQQNGQGDVAHSWIGTGPNQSISPSDLERAAGADTLDELARETGMPRDRLLDSLQSELPEGVDSLTPEGRIPTEQEASRWL
jgi:uncharacterized protein YidB (DUF937 family)